MICSLLMYEQTAHFKASTQWIEHRLDDSANRRIIIADAFLTVIAILVTECFRGFVSTRSCDSQELTGAALHGNRKHNRCDGTTKGGNS